MRTARWITVALAAAVTLACGGGPRWEARHEGLPPYMKVAAVLVARPDRVIVAGHAVPDGGLGPITAREPRIYAFQGAPARLAWGEGKGWIVAADTRDGEVWAVHARLRPEGEGSLYELLVSGDGGVSWAARGPVPASSLTSIAVAGGGAGWAHGAYNLWRTEDGGATWTAIAAPGTRNAMSEQVVALSSTSALLAGEALLRTEDGGATWRAVTNDDVAATDGRFAVGPAPGGLRIGRVEAGGVRWGATHPGEQLAVQLASEGERVTVLASEVGDRAGRGPVLLRSEDGGVMIDEERVSGPADPSFYALHGPDGLVMVDQGRAVRLRGLAAR